MKKLTAREIKWRLRDADASILNNGTDWELEIDHFYVEDNEDLDGWYAYKYSEKRCEAVPMQSIDGNDFIIALDSELEQNGIDIYKILNEYGCFYCE